VKLSRTLVAVAVGAVVPLIPMAAQANTYSHTDGTGDVYSTVSGSGSFTPAPDRTVGDVVGSTVKHKRHAVVLQLRYVDLEVGSEINAHYFAIRTNTMRRDVTLVAAGTFPNGRAEMTKPNRKRVTCRIPHKIDYTLNTATVVVPRSCLGNPRWVKVRMAGLSFTGLGPNDTTWVDDALSAGTSGAFSPRVFR
jgi:hypothetical protein